MILLKDKIQNINNLKLKATYFGKYNSDKTSLDITSIDLPPTHVEEVKKNFLETSELPISNFDVENTLDDQVYSFQDYDRFKYYNAICTHFNISNPHTKNNNESIQVKDEIFKPRLLKFTIYHFTDTINGIIKDILIFIKQERVSLNEKKNIFKIFDDSDFQLVSKDKYYMFSTQPTCIFINNDVYVVDFKKFINLFNYKQYLEEKVKNIIELIKVNKIISNYTTYENSLSHYRNFNALSKLPQDIKLIKSHVAKHSHTISNIQKDYICNFKFDDTNKSFEIEDENGLKLVIRILSNQAGFNFDQELMTFSTNNLVEKRKQ